MSLVIHVLKTCKNSIYDSIWRARFLLQTDKKMHNIHLFPEYLMSAAMMDSNFPLGSHVPVFIGMHVEMG